MYMYIYTNLLKFNFYYIFLINYCIYNKLNIFQIRII